MCLGQRPRREYLGPILAEKEMEVLDALMELDNLAVKKTKIVECDGKNHTFKVIGEHHGEPIVCCPGCGKQECGFEWVNK